MSLFWLPTHWINAKPSFTTVTNEHVLHAVMCGDFVCKSVSGEGMCHWELAKYTKEQVMSEETLARKGLEPYYAEKIQILKDIGRWKKVALEVFPAMSELVDREDVYHMWEYPHLESFCVNVQPIFDPPNRFKESFGGIYYAVLEQGRATYIYFQSDDNVPWRKKQALKNHIVGYEREGVEIITEKMQGVGYGVMIILPQYLHLTFGLE